MIPAAAICSVLAASTARIVVVPVVLPEDHSAITPLDLSRRVSDRLAEMSGVTLVEERDLPLSEPSLRVRVGKCGADEDCLASMVASLDVDRALLVLLDAELDPPLFALRLIEAGAGTAARAASPISSPEEIGPKVDAFLESAGFVRTARLFVRVEPEGAALLLDGRPIAPGEVRIAPGSHRLRAELEGHTSVEERIDLEPAAVRRVDLRVEPERSQFPWWWIAIGVVAAGAAAAGIAVAVDRDCLCTGVDPARCPGC